MEADYQIRHEKYLEPLSRVILHGFTGKVSKAVGLTFEAILPGSSIGSLCRLDIAPNVKPVTAEVIGFRGNKVVLMPLEEAHGINAQSKVRIVAKQATVKISDALLGRVLDGAGKPMDRLPAPPEGCDRGIYAAPVNPLEREPITENLDLGIRAINGLITCGSGQRMGIMAGSGVGKSVLLGMIARYTKADINVIALVGERGREVREFLERDLGPEGLKRSIVVVATSEQSALLRMRAAHMATTIAEHFADSGKKVLLLMDSLTRFCMAQREIGLSMGEPPATKGYTPSVFASLPRLLERAGSRGRKGGSITGLYTVLVEGDDLDDPIADAARSILDGHIVLSRALADKGHFPSIDVLASVSRVMRSVSGPEHVDLAAQMRELMSIYREAEDLINIGAYVRGSNPRIDRAIELNDFINRFLRQDVSDRSAMADTVNLMRAIVRGG
ncbi:MAG: FliI/YscN family ATPase [Bdellovibrionales bacterium]|nr:FliI/YscN family ATPase [Bdellovibrionales bacterium]